LFVVIGQVFFKDHARHATTWKLPDYIADMSAPDASVTTSFPAAATAGCHRQTLTSGAEIERFFAPPAPPAGSDRNSAVATSALQPSTETIEAALATRTHAIKELLTTEKSYGVALQVVLTAQSSFSTFIFR
jgi:hypothetical protein